jgi:hypothetical protein
MEHLATPCSCFQMSGYVPIRFRSQPSGLLDLIDIHRPHA